MCVYGQMMFVAGRAEEEEEDKEGWKSLIF